MYVGNRQALDEAREALRDQFDAIWIESDTLGPRETRAVRCAIALDKPGRTQAGWNKTIFPGGWCVGPHNLVIRA